MSGPINLIPAMPDQNSVEIRWLALPQIGLGDWPSLERMLDDPERERAGRFRFERDRNAYVAAHALLRGMLSGLVRRDPADCGFAPGQHGKPHLVADAGVPPFSFNISHTRGLVAVAITVESEI